MLSTDNVREDALYKNIFFFICLFVVFCLSLPPKRYIGNNKVALTYILLNDMKTAKDLFDELNSWDENRRIEAKSASAVGKSMMGDPLCFCQ